MVKRSLVLVSLVLVGCGGSVGGSASAVDAGAVDAELELEAAVDAPAADVVDDQVDAGVDAELESDAVDAGVDAELEAAVDAAPPASLCCVPLHDAGAPVACSSSSPWSCGLSPNQPPFACSSSTPPGEPPCLVGDHCAIAGVDGYVAACP